MRLGARLFIITSLLILSATSSFAEPIDEGDSKQRVDELAAEFQGNIVMLEVNRSSAMESKSSNVVISDARIHKVGDRYFVLGKGYVPDESEYTWYKGVTIGVPWDSVLRFSAMTPDQFAEYAKQWKEHSKN
jgi:hypothetical protein